MGKEAKDLSRLREEPAEDASPERAARFDRPVRLHDRGSAAPQSEAETEPDADADPSEAERSEQD